MIYNHKPSAYFHKYADEKKTPLYPFGYGLSYTNYKYSKPLISKYNLNKENTILVTTEITNTGEFDGEEIAQLYIRDNVSSVTRPVKELKGYQRVFLKAGETKKIKFTINSESLAFYDINMNYVVEPGTFTVMTGSSSNDKDLKKTILTINKKIKL